MKMKWIGHSMFLLTGSDGTRVATDPFSPGCFDGALSYDSTGVEADIVTVSHQHDDHNASWTVKGGPAVFDKAGSFEHKGVRILGVQADHDDEGGAKRGKILIFRIEMDGLAVAHLGDLGHELSAQAAGRIGRVDVALAPFGGFFTIDGKQAMAVARSLGARILVPMHFKTPKVKFPIKPADDFLPKAAWVKRKGAGPVEINAGNLPAALEAWVLDYSG